MVAQPRRPSHSRATRSTLHRAQPARANPGIRDISEAGADGGTDQAHTPTPDELDLHRRLRGRRNTPPIFLIAGLAALVLAGGLTLLASRPDEPKPGPGPIATGPAAPPPALDPSSASATTTPALA